MIFVNAPFEVRFYSSLTHTLSRVSVLGLFLGVLILSGIGYSEEEAKGVCGINCMYAALSMVGKEVDRLDLINEKYIDTSVGQSTFAQLSQLGKDYGLYTAAVKNMTLTMLRTSPFPVVVNVKKSFSSTSYDHYVLYLGTSKDMALILDLPNKVESVPFKKFAAKWNGKGLYVASEPFDVGAITRAGQIVTWRNWIIGIVFVLLLRTCWMRFSLNMPTVQKNRVWGSLIQFTAIFLAVIMGSLIFHLVSDKGFLSLSDNVEVLVTDNVEKFMDKVSAQDVLAHIEAGDAVFVDARMDVDYTAGHIEGAINLTPGTTDEQCQKVMSSVADKTAPIIVYCQSQGCPFARTIAKTLYAIGYKNLSLYKPGWIEIKEHLSEETHPSKKVEKSS